MPKHTTSRSPTPGDQSSSRPAKRAQVVVACQHCRRGKVKCDGLRPACSRCRRSEYECTYTVPWPDASPITAIKRQYSELQRQSADDQALVHKLTTLPQHEALQVLDQLRRGQDFDLTLQSGSELPIPTTQAERFRPAHRNHNPAERHTIAVPHMNSALIASSHNRLHVTRKQSMPNMKPTPHNTGGSQQTLSYPHQNASSGVSDGPACESSSNSLIRKSPSAPELSISRNSSSASVLRIPTWRHDPRLDRAYARDWGVFYLEDEAFRNIICSYLVWDHQAWRFFDEDDFLEGLMHAPSITCSSALVHAVIAFGSKNYVWVDAETSDAAGKVAAVEAERLWHEEDTGDRPLATAAAGLLIWNNNGAVGFDKDAEPYVLRVKDVADRMNLYNKRSYNTEDARADRAKAIFIWGVYSWLAFCEFTLGKEYSLPRLPPDLTHHLVEHFPEKKWMPWPRNDPQIPALTNDIFIVRSSIMMKFLEIRKLHSNHTQTGLSHEYLDASLGLHHRLRTVWNSAASTVYLPDQWTPQLLLLHCWFHYAVLQLFRPFVTTPTFTSIHSHPLDAAKLPVEPALSFARSAAHQLRQLLTLGSTIFAGLQTPIIFSQAAVAVAIETLPFASPLSASYSLSAENAFVIALRTLHRMGGAFTVLRSALLGIKQTAIRLQLHVPPEAEDIFDQAQKEISSKRTTSSIRAGWVVDLSSSGTGVQAARLENLVSALSDLDLSANRRGKISIRSMLSN